MPRQNREEFLAELAAAKLEGFEEAQALIEKLLESGLSLGVARYALDEHGGILIDAKTNADAIAAATRVEKPKMKKPRAPAPPADEIPPPQIVDPI